MAFDKKAYLKEWKMKNKDKVSEYQKNYMKEYNKNYYEKNKEELKEQMKKNSKNWSEQNKDKRAINQKKHAEKYPQKVFARGIADRQVPLKSSCEICGDKESLERHHWNYEKPLLVNTLCKPCHQIQHLNKFTGGF
jgi:hypothetical protein